MTWELSLTGLLIGVLVGMTGMGGGSLMTPVLVLVFDFNVVLAVGTDILHGAIFKTIGAWRHRMLGHVHARLTFWLALGSVPASLAGVYVIEVLKDRFGEDINDVASRILPASTRLRPGILTHVHLQAAAERRVADGAPRMESKRTRTISATASAISRSKV